MPKNWPRRSKKIVELGGQAEAFACDVTSRESVDQVVDGIVESWDRVDILVNNAGITRDTLLPRMSDDEWDDVINTNLRGMFLFSRAASRYMMRARYGRIINMASVSGLMGNPGPDELLGFQGWHDRLHAKPQSGVSGAKSHH